jgi:hypothetical protein
MFGYRIKFDFETFENATEIEAKNPQENYLQ